MTQWVDICATDDVEKEEVFRFNHSGQRFIIVRDHEGRFYCTDGLCTHEEVDLSDGLVVETTIECPKHGSIFDVRTGEVDSPPACENLATYQTKVEAGRVFAKI